jgi:predicted permease
VVIEVALSIVLLVGAGLLVRSVAELGRTDPGIAPRGLYGFQLNLPRERFANAPARGAAQGSVVDAVRALPGVRGASLSLSVPPTSGFWAGGEIQIDGRASDVQEKKPLFGFNMVDPEHFRTVGLPLQSGRTFAASRDSSTRPAGEVVVSETFARTFWPQGDALGGRFRPVSSNMWMTIVGIVRDVRMPGRNEFDTHGQVYWALAMGYPSARLLVRSDEPLSTLVPRVTAAIATVAPGVRVGNIRSAETLIDDAIASPRFVTVLLAAFAALAFVLSAVGLYGVLAYSVRQRTREMGIRVALGAQTMHVLTLVVGDGLRLAAIGIVVGVGGALIATRALRTMLFGVGPGDPATFGIVVAALVTTAAIASYVPARRATRVDPVEALRAD